MEQEKQYTLHQVIEHSFDFDGYDQEQKTALIDETAGMIFEAALLRSLDNATPEVENAFTTFTESDPDEEAMSAFIATHFPQFQDMLVEEIKIFKQIGDEEKSADANSAE